jgi:hypothetical protein
MATCPNIKVNITVTTQDESAEYAAYDEWFRLQSFFDQNDTWFRTFSKHGFIVGWHGDNIDGMSGVGLMEGFLAGQNARKWYNNLHKENIMEMKIGDRVECFDDGRSVDLGVLVFRNPGAKQQYFVHTDSGCFRSFKHARPENKPSPVKGETYAFWGELMTVVVVGTYLQFSSGAHYSDGKGAYGYCAPIPDTWAASGYPLDREWWERNSVPFKM